MADQLNVDGNAQNAVPEDRAPDGQIRDEFVIPAEREEQLQASIQEQKRDVVQEANSGIQNIEQGGRPNEMEGLESNQQNDQWRNNDNQNRGGGRGGSFFHGGGGRGGLGVRERGNQERGGNQEHGGYGRSQPQRMNSQWAPYDDTRARRMGGGDV